jgi:hypothetical protein
MKRRRLHVGVSDLDRSIGMAWRNRVREIRRLDDGGRSVG